MVCLSELAALRFRTVSFVHFFAVKEMDSKDIPSFLAHSFPKRSGNKTKRCFSLKTLLDGSPLSLLVQRNGLERKDVGIATLPPGEFSPQVPCD